MDREEGEALLRRMQEEAAKSAQSQESSGEDDTQTVREGTTRAIDADDLSTMRRERGLTEGDAFTQAERVGGFEADPALAKPPDLPESIDDANVAPDGTVIGDRTLTSPTSEAISGSSQGAAIRGRADSLGGDALGGSRLDPLGLTDLGGGSPSVDSPSDREIELAISEHDGSHVSAENSDPVGQGTLNALASGLPPSNPVGQGTLNALASGLPPSNPVGQGTLNALASGLPPSNPDEEKPDPTAGDDVITAESIAAAIKLNDPGVYAQTTEDSGTVEGNATNLADNDPQIITNYGPEGPQAVEVGADWTPPVDTLFDPPPEGGSTAMMGDAPAMADPGATFGGAVIGSSTPEGQPDPPPAPPGDDSDGGPLGPPGGGEG